MSRLKGFDQGLSEARVEGRVDAQFALLVLLRAKADRLGTGDRTGQQSREE
jgi:hypothetical protein